MISGKSTVVKISISLSVKSRVIVVVYHVARVCKRRQFLHRARRPTRGRITKHGHGVVEWTRGQGGLMKELSFL